MSAPERPDPLLGRPLTPAERSALNALMASLASLNVQLEASRRDREARAPRQDSDPDGWTRQQRGDTAIRRSCALGYLSTAPRGAEPPWDAS